MTDVMSRYGQTELEAAAIEWALTKKFHYYLAGCQFTVFTDCKALLPLWNSPHKINIPPRIERVILVLPLARQAELGGTRSPVVAHVLIVARIVLNQGSVKFG